MLVQLVAGTNLNFGNGRIIRAGEPMPEDVVSLPNLGRQIQLGRIRASLPSAEVAGGGRSAATGEPQGTLPLKAETKKKPAMAQDANRKGKR